MCPIQTKLYKLGAASLTAVISLHQQLSGMNELEFGAQVIF